jgi:aerobic carbon-monoxide dehydrogenase large subunit
MRGSPLAMLRKCARCRACGWVLTAADVGHLGAVPCLAPMPNADGHQMALPDYPVLAREEVRHVGDAVAMVVADTEAQAREALEAIAVTYEAEPAIIDLDRALDKDAPLVWPRFNTNIAYENAMGSADAVKPIFDKAARVVALDIINNRLLHGAARRDRRIRFGP